MSVTSTVLARIIDREGRVFTNLPADRGGPTKFGITLPFWDDVTGTTHTVADLQALTEDQAKTIYLHWMQAHRLDEIDDLAILDAVVDFAVHSGVKAAVKALQRALDVPQDGVIGPVTLQAMTDADSSATIVRWVTAQRLRKLGMILANNPTQIQFARGWLNRVAGLLEA